MILRSGVYAGNGSARDINVGDIGGAITCVIIISNWDRAVFVTSSTTAGETYYFTNDTPSYTGGITLGTNKFSLDTSANVNNSSGTYFWLAIRDDGAGDFTVNSYTGNGTAQNITTAGFQEDLIIVKGNTTVANKTVAMWWDSTDTTHSTGMSGNNANILTGITGVLSNGFVVGADDSVNKNGVVYFYIAIKNTASKFKVLKYTENGSTGNAITGVGFLPDWTMIQDFAALNAAGKQRDKS